MIEHLLSQGESCGHIFFYLLGDATRANTSHSPVVRIPNTVLHTYSKPVAWFSFDERTGDIVRRPKSDLSAQHIVDELLRCVRPPPQVPPHLAVRGWLLRCLPGESRYSIIGQKKCGRDGLTAFVQAPKAKGILQAYVYDRPGTDGSLRHSVVHCTYTPSSFFVEKHVSLHSLTDKRIPLELRLAIEFPGRTAGEKVQRLPVVSASVADRYYQTCRAIVERAASLGYVITHLVIVCRVDPNDNLYVLWCDSMTLRTPTGVVWLCLPDGCSQVVAQRRKQRIGSRQIAAVLSRADSLWISERQRCAPNIPCPICGHVNAATAAGDMMMPRVQKRYVLLCLSYLDRHAQGWEGLVPPSVALLHPSISVAEFDLLKSEAAWLDEFIMICDDCITRCNVALAKMSTEKIPAPSWLGIDERYRHAQRAMRPSMVPASPSELHDSIHRLIQQADLTRLERASSVNAGPRRVGGGVEQASKSDVEAAEFFSLSHEGHVWHKVGFGRPIRSHNMPLAMPPARDLTNPNLRVELMARLESVTPRGEPPPFPQYRDQSHGVIPPCTTPVR